MSGREGHVALVTGAGTGIGAATARLLAERGMHVALAGRRRELLDETARAIEATGTRALVLPGDLGDPARSGAARPRDRQGARPSRRARQQRGDDRRRAARRVHGRAHRPAPRSQHARSPAAHAEGHPPLTDSPDGAIVNVSSSVGSIVKPGNGLYGMTKAALEYLTRASAYELADRRIRVNCIAPGPVETPIHEVWADDLEAAYADLSPRPARANGVAGGDRRLGLDARRSRFRVDHRQCDPRRRRPGARAAAGRGRLEGRGRDRQPTLPSSSASVRSPSRSSARVATDPTTSRRLRRPAAR